MTAAIFIGASSSRLSMQQGEKAVFLAAHNPAIAEASDWIREMNDGRIVASHPHGQRSFS
jgi:ABC-type bacteriocin/lantibiotic exporter with double-glycine peptidase domain